MTKKYNVVPIEDYYVVVDETDLVNIGDIVIHGNIALKEGWNWGIHIVENAKSADNLTRIREMFKGHSENPKLQTVISKTVVGSIGKRIGDLPLIEIPDEGTRLSKVYFPEGSVEYQRLIWLDGYNKAATKKYSEKDMEAAWEGGIKEGEHKKGEPIPLPFSIFFRLSE